PRSTRAGLRPVLRPRICHDGDGDRAETADPGDRAMMPVLFQFHLFGWDISLPTYGFILAVAFLMALWVAVRQARKAGIESGVVTDLWIVSLISGVLGAKLLLYLLDFRHYLAHPWDIVSTLRSAGVFYGGLIAAILVCLVVVKRRGLNGWLIGDVLA